MCDRAIIEADVVDDVDVIDMVNIVEKTEKVDEIIKVGVADRICEIEKPERFQDKIDQAK